MQTVILASSNEGKLKEIHFILRDLPIKLIPQAEKNIASPPETGTTFIENAIIKARHAAHQTGLPAIADDSGLCVRALDGKPGVHSARYAGEQTSAKARIEKLRGAMQGKKDRYAFFYSCIVWMNSPNDPAPLIALGQWEGEILEAPRGTEGFGYDPIVFIPTEGCTAAELSPERKNQLSHRAQALRHLKTLLHGQSSS